MSLRFFIQRCFPKRHEIENHPRLKIFGALFHEPQYWEINQKNLPKAVAIGLFVCWLPIPGQMIIAAALALLLRANLFIAIALAWASNPLTMVPMLYAGYKTGAFILYSSSDEKVQFQYSLHWVTTHFHAIASPLLLGVVICGLVSGALGYFITLFFYWLKRRKR